VPYHIRVCIDNEIRVAYWYDVYLLGAQISCMEHIKDKLDKADLRMLAFDIETSKAELKFPDSRFDPIMMISYMIDGKGFLITNRQVTDLIKFRSWVKMSLISSIPLSRSTKANSLCLMKLMRSNCSRSSSSTSRRPSHSFS